MRALIRSPVLAFTCAGDGRRGHCVAPPGGKEQPARAPPPPPPDGRAGGRASCLGDAEGLDGVEAVVRGPHQHLQRLPDVHPARARARVGEVSIDGEEGVRRRGGSDGGKWMWIGTVFLARERVTI